MPIRHNAASGGATTSALAYDELALVVGQRLMDDGLTPSDEAFGTLAQHGADCRTPDDRARAFGRLAIDGANIPMLVQARDLQRFMIEHLESRHPDEMRCERIRLELIQAWLDADRTALDEAACRLWLTRRD